MNLRKFIIGLLFVMAVLPSGLRDAAAGETSAQPYEEARERNRGHVGNYQRREAYREFLAGAGADEARAAAVEPAGGDEAVQSAEKPEKSEMKKAPELNRSR